jgi:HTH-type transcriptional regulator/antitoxin MqsA
MPDLRCHECGGEMIEDVRPKKITYKGRSATIDLRGQFCVNCSESVFSGKDLSSYDVALNRLKSESEHLLLPEEIRRIRKKLQLTQEKAGIILGGGPAAFHKYENGTGLPSQAISNLLRLLDANPQGLMLFTEPTTNSGGVSTGMKRGISDAEALAVR